MADAATIYTIGHGRHPFDYFLQLLRERDIRFVCDVRSFARSRWPQFNGAVLHGLLKENDVGYEHIPEVGARVPLPPEDIEWGVSRIVEIASELTAVMMCSESHPLTTHRIPRSNCHRIDMLSPMLKSRGIDRIVHILPDGRTTEFDESAVPPRF